MPESPGKPAMQPNSEMELAVGYSICSIVLLKADCWSVSAGAGAIVCNVSLMILLFSLSVAGLLLMDTLSVVAVAADSPMAMLWQVMNGAKKQTNIEIRIIVFSWPALLIWLTVIHNKSYNQKYYFTAFKNCGNREKQLYTRKTLQHLK